MKTIWTEQIKCAWCGELFTKRRPNMVYCKKECCNAATNKKLIEKYHKEKARKKQKNRKCEVCNSNLSRYNSDNICHSCQARESDLQRMKILRELGFEYILEE